MSAWLIVFLLTYGTALTVSWVVAVFGLGLLATLSLGRAVSRPSVAGPHNPAGSILVMLGGGVLACLLACWHLQAHRQADQLAWPAQRDVVAGWWTGEVVGLPVYRQGQVHVTFQVSQWAPFDAFTPAVPVERQVRVRWRDEGRVQWLPGQHWVLPLRIRRVTATGMSQNSFSGWGLPEPLPVLWGTPVSGRQPYLSELQPQGWLTGLYRWRYQLRARLASAVDADSNQERSAQAFLMALTLGDRSGFTSSDWRLLQRTGTTHLMAISGFHVGVVFLLVYLFTRHAWLWLPGVHQRVAANRIAFVLAMSAAIGYAMLSGMGIPAQRAVIMLGVVGGMRLFAAQQGWWLPTLTALTVVLMINPWATGSAGFWLSFAAVISILWVTTGRPLRKPSWWKALLRVQWAVTLGLLPFTLAHFQQVAWLGCLINLIAVPLFVCLLMPSVLLVTLLSVLGLCPPLVMDGLIQALATAHQALAWCARLPGVWFAPVPDHTMLAVAVFGVVWLLLPSRFPGRPLGWLLVFPLLCPAMLPGALQAPGLVVLASREGIAVVLSAQQGGKPLVWLQSHQAASRTTLRHLQDYLSWRGVPDTGWPGSLSSAWNPLHVRWLTEHFGRYDIPLAKAAGNAMTPALRVREACALAPDPVEDMDWVAVYGIVVSIGSEHRCALVVSRSGQRWLLLSHWSADWQLALARQWSAQQLSTVQGIVATGEVLTGALLNQLQPRQIVQLGTVPSDQHLHSSPAIRARNVQHWLLRDAAFWWLAWSADRAPVPATEAVTRVYW